MKLKRKREQQSLRVDFVTALTVEECRARLEQETARMAPDWQRIFLRDDNSFIIERLVELPLLVSSHQDRRLEVRFKGALDAVEGGTRVQGGITGDTQDRFRWEARAPAWIAFVVAVVGILFWLVLGSLPMCLAWTGLGGLVMAAVVWRWQTIRWYPLDLLTWVRQQLSVPLSQENEM